MFALFFDDHDWYHKFDTITNININSIIMATLIVFSALQLHHFHPLLPHVFIFGNISPITICLKFCCCLLAFIIIIHYHQLHYHPFHFNNIITFINPLIASCSPQRSDMFTWLYPRRCWRRESFSLPTPALFQWNRENANPMWRYL